MPLSKYISWKNIKFFASIITPIAIFSFIFWKDWDSIGTTEDEAYVYSRENKVLDISTIEIKAEDRKRKIIYSPTFEPCEKKFGPLKIISRNFPPVYSIDILGVKIPILIWPHITYLTYLPQNISILLGERIGIKELILAEKSLNYILVCIVILLSYIIGNKLYGDQIYGFFTALFFATLSATKFFSLIGISIDFIFHTLYFWLSVLFLMEFYNGGKYRALIISSLFCALCILSYIKFSSWAFLFILSLISSKGNIGERIKSASMFMILPSLAFLIFYFIPSTSLHFIGCEGKYRIEVFSSTLNLITGALNFYKTEILKNLNLVYTDVFRMISTTGYGYRLAYHDNLDFELVHSVPFLISLIYCFLFGNQKLVKEVVPGRAILILFILYDLLLFFELPFLGFHRKLRPIMPGVCLIIAKLCGDITSKIISVRSIKNKMVLIIALIILLTMHLSFQIMKGEIISNKLKKSGKWSIQTSYQVQKKLAEFVSEVKEKNGGKIANFSATVNLDIILREDKVIDYDFSYIVHFSKSYLLTDIIFWEISFRTICQIGEKENIYILADGLTFEFLQKKAHKVAEIGLKEEKPIFYIFKCEDKIK